MLRKIVLGFLCVVPLASIAMGAATDTLGMCDRAADIWCNAGELGLVREYKKNPAMRPAIKQSITEDLESQIDSRARNARIDFWLELAKVERAAQLAQHLRTIGALDDRDGSKRRAATELQRQKSHSRKGLREAEEKEAGAQQKTACLLM